MTPEAGGKEHDETRADHGLLKKAHMPALWLLRAAREKGRGQFAPSLFFYLGQRRVTPAHILINLKNQSARDSFLAIVAITP